MLVQKTLAARIADLHATTVVHHVNLYPEEGG